MSYTSVENVSVKISMCLHVKAGVFCQYLTNPLSQSSNHELMNIAEN